MDSKTIKVDKLQFESYLERQRQEYEKRLKEEKFQREKERIEQERRYMEEIQKQFKEELKQQAKQIEEMMKKIQEDNERRSREQEERMYKFMDKMKRKIEEAKNLEEKRRLEEKERRENEKKILYLFKLEKEKKIKEEIEKIKDKFIQDSNNFCVEEIKKYNKGKILNLVNSFKISENFNFVLKEKIKKLTNEYLNSKDKAINHLNIILVGLSGVGKSTLINSVLELDGFDCSEEGKKTPCTMGSPKYFDSNKVNFIRLADSQEIVEGSYGIESAVKDVKNFIEAQLLSKDPNRYVHCLWYCITGARFEEKDKQMLEELAKISYNKTLPIIVVYTKAMMPNLYKPIEARVKELKRGLEFVPVISKDIEIEKECDDDDDEENEEGEKVKKKRIVKKKGIKKLMLLSCDKAKGAVQSSCYIGIKNNIKEDAINNNKQQNKLMEEYIKQVNESKISKLKEGMYLNDIVDVIEELIQDVIKEYLYGKETVYLRTESSERIKSFLKEFFQKYLNDYQIIFKEFIEKQSEEISNKLYEFQKDINRKNNDKLKKIKKIIKNILKKN